MRIALKAEIEADLILSATVTAKLHPYDFEIFKENNKLWLKVSKPVKDYEDYLPKVFIENGVMNIAIGKDDLFKDLLEWLQYIEAMGSFNLQIDRVHWDRATFCWIAETEAEHSQTPFTEYTRAPQRGRRSKRLKSSNLFNIVMHRRQLEDIYIPFTYYKEGQRFFNNFNYYFAFINFFMMLEYCFADGKFHQSDVMRQFRESRLLRMCLLEFLAMPTLHKGDDLWDMLEEECKRRNKEFGVDGMIYMLLMLRGELSHASSKSEKRYRDDNELRPWVVVISTICFLLCGHLQIYGFTNDETKKQLIENNIETFGAVFDSKRGKPMYGD